MEPEKSSSDESSLTKKGLLNASEFGKLIGCSKQAVTLMFGDKLTEGVSYLKEGRKIFIDVDSARKELRATVKLRTCRNKKLLEFLEFTEEMAAGARAEGAKWVADLDAAIVRREMAKSELRLSLMKEEVLARRYVERKMVESNLESIGIVIRNSFLDIPARITALIRAAATERDAENAAYTAIADVLEQLSNLISKDISV